MNFFRRIVVSAALAVTSSLAPLALAQSVPEIPVETLFRKSEYRALTFSPDQKFMAALMPINSRYNLVVIDLEKRNANRVTNFDKADVLNFWWASNDRLLFTTGDMLQLAANAGDGGLFAVDKDGRNSRILIQPISATPGQYVLRLTSYRGRIKDNKEEVIVSSNDRSADSSDLYKMNIYTGRKSLLSFDSPGKVNNWVLDRNNEPRAAYRADGKEGGGYSFFYRSDARQPFRELRKWDHELKDIVIPLSFAPDNKTMFVASNIGRDTMAFFKFDPDTNTLGELVYGDDRFDMYTTGLIGGGGLGEGGSIRFGGREEDLGTVIGVSYNADKPKTVWFDPDIQKAQATLDAALPKGNVNVWNPNHRRALVRSYSDTDLGRYYIFDQDKKTLEETGVRPASWIEPKQMRPMQYVSWLAADGMKIDGYLTLPAAYGTGKPVPLVLHPHGGPWAKDNWGYNPEVQFLANRGYAVLQPNFRGSTGYGTKHLKASYKTWGDAMIDDMIAGVEWAVKEGYADKNRLAVYGASYGGYATLMALVKRPDLFKWGVNYVGVSDMFVHQDTQPAQRYGEFGEVLAKLINGDQKADREMFERTSPARHVAKIQAPVFHAYGGVDRNVDIENGRVIRAAFDKAGKSQEWMYVADEAHGYRLDKNVFEYYNRFDAFMKKNMPAAK
jgi:dipeptidyl aminopeptidase/acylaminoacyl peptidase